MTFPESDEKKFSYVAVIALAALLLDIRSRTGHRPHVYFHWSEGNPALNYLRYLLFGHGEVAPVTREILRRHVPDPALRPHVHAG